MIKNLSVHIFLTLAVFLKCAGASWSADYRKGMEAGNRGDFVTAIRELSPLAKNGDANSQFALGQIYHQGLGVEIDYNKARMLYLKAANQGHAKSQCNLGVIYANGLGVQQNYTIAVKWFKLSAKQGNPDAKANLGLIYRRNLVLPDVNKKKSL